MPPASHPGPCTSLITPSFVVATSVADCRDERIIHKVVGAIHELPPTTGIHQKFTGKIIVSIVWEREIMNCHRKDCSSLFGTRRKISGIFLSENNRFYRLGTGNFNRKNKYFYCTRWRRSRSIPPEGPAAQRNPADMGLHTRWRHPAAQRYPADMGPQDELPFNQAIDRFYRLGTGNCTFSLPNPPPLWFVVTTSVVIHKLHWVLAGQSLNYP